MYSILVTSSKYPIFSCLFQQILHKREDRERKNQIDSEREREKGGRKIQSDRERRGKETNNEKERGRWLARQTQEQLDKI